MIGLGAYETEMVLPTAARNVIIGETELQRGDIMSSVTNWSCAIFLGLVAFSVQAHAQVIAQLPYPHAATCSDFKHHRANNTWSPKGGIQITSSSGTVSLSPGNAIAEGQIIGGYDLGTWLDTNCRKSKEW